MHLTLFLGETETVSLKKKTDSNAKGTNRWFTLYTSVDTSPEVCQDIYYLLPSEKLVLYPITVNSFTPKGFPNDE